MNNYPIVTKIPPNPVTRENLPGFLIMSQKASLAAIQKLLPVREI